MLYDAWKAQAALFEDDNPVEILLERLAMAKCKVTVKHIEDNGSLSFSSFVLQHNCTTGEWAVADIVPS